jgi:hypothetical protein
MRKSWQIWCAGALFLMALPLAAQQTIKEAESEAGSPDQYEKILNPADVHELLGRFVGSWTAVHKVLLYGSPMRTSSMKESFEAKWILNDHFIEVNFDWDINNTPLKGIATMGYNGADKRFFRLFLINKDPRGTYSTGVFVRSKNALVFRGMEHDPVSGDSFEKRDVFTFGPDKDKIFYEQFYNFADGSEVKPVEGTFTRVKAPAPPK